MSDLVGNAEDRFSHDTTLLSNDLPISLELRFLKWYITPSAYCRPVYGEKQNHVNPIGKKIEMSIRSSYITKYELFLKE